MTDLEVELMNLETNEFYLYKNIVTNQIHLLNNKKNLNYNTAKLFIEIHKEDFKKCEDEYRKKYPNLFRKYKINNLLNENNN